ncbi:MAG: hypothetical protein LUD81_06630, partial [Clostridiales bacterium]|nr:hypothetical protein [Clostridiales bacterium]
MALPLIVVAVPAAMGAAGAAKMGKGAVDSGKANKIQKKTEAELETAKNHLEKVRKNTSSSIEKLGKTKLEIYSREIKKFADVFSQIKHFSLDKSVGLCEIEKLNTIKGNIGEMKDISLKAKIFVVGGAAGM